MRLAFVGYGSIARQHARALLGLRDRADAADLQLVGVMGRVESSAEEFAREFDLEVVTTSLETLLDRPDVTAVVICSPTDLHATQAEQALRAGKHVGNMLGIGLIDLAVSAALVTMLPGIVGLMHRPLVHATFDPRGGSGAQATSAVA